MARDRKTAGPESGKMDKAGNLDVQSQHVSLSGQSHHSSINGQSRHNLFRSLIGQPQNGSCDGESQHVIEPATPVSLEVAEPGIPSMIIYLLGFVVYFCDESVGGLMPLLKSDADLTKVECGFLYAAGHGFAILLACWTASYLGHDQDGPRTVLVWAAICLLVGSGFFATAVICRGLLSKVAMLSFGTIGRVVWGLGFTPIESICAFAVSDNAFSTGIMVAAFELGAAAGAAAFPNTGSWLGLTVGVSLDPAFALIAPLAVGCLSRQFRFPEEPKEGFDGCEALPIAAWLVMFTSTTSYVATMANLVFLTDQLHSEWGYTLSEAGWMTSGVMFCCFVVSPSIGYYVENAYDEHHMDPGAEVKLLARLNIVGAGLVLAGDLVLLWGGFIWVALPLLGVGYGLVPVMCKAQLGLLPPKVSAMAFCVNAGAEGGVTLLLTPLLGVLTYDQSNAVIAVLAGVGLAFAVATWLLHTFGYEWQSNTGIMNSEDTTVLAA